MIGISYVAFGELMVVLLYFHKVVVVPVMNKICKYRMKCEIQEQLKKTEQAMDIVTY